MANSSLRCVITPRDLEVLAALDRCSLTAQQLLNLSRSFGLPFTTERRVRERLQQLEQQHWLTSWLYATASRGGSPSYTAPGWRWHKMIWARFGVVEMVPMVASR